MEEFLAAAATITAGGVTPMPLGYVIDLGNGATATCVAVNGSVIGVGAIPNGTVNENDRAICLLIQYGDFDYLVTGDVGGGNDDYDCTGRSTTQVNIETPMVQAIMPGGANPLLNQYGVELAHVSHHGSESSTNVDYMNALSPSVTCISVGDGQSTSWYHPRIDVVDNVLLAGVPCVTVAPALVLQTEEGAPAGSGTSFSGYCAGDIFITTDGVSSYTVSATGAVSQGPDERAAAGLPTIYSFNEVIGGDPAPSLFNIRAENVGDNSADIAWSTNEPATSVVRYGTVSGTYPNTVSDTSQVLNHQLSLTVLTVATTYYYVVESTDATSNTTTSDEKSFTTTGTAPTRILFSEVYYDTVGTDFDEEWIELYNDASANIDLSGWTITDNNDTGATFTIPNGTSIKAGTYLTIASDSVGFNALYGYDADVYGAIPALNNSGDTVILKDGSGNVVDFTAWEGGASGGVPDGWGSTSQPSAPTGCTIVRTDPATDTDTYLDWSIAANNGNPQTQPTSYSNVLFSEIFYDPPGDENAEEWIELYNNMPNTVDLGGWTIIDNNGTGFSYTFPTGETIAPGTFYTVARNSAGFTALYGYEADQYGNLPYLNNSGETIILYDSMGTEIDAVAWEGGASAGIPDGWGSTSNPWAYTGNTIVRIDPTVDSDSYTDWTYATNNGNPQTQITPGNIFFTEIYYDTVGTDSIEEWIELYNNSSFAVNIGGWTITDNNGTGFIFTIPEGEIIEPGTFYTLARASSGFMALYGYEADLYGGLPTLNNSGDTLILYDPIGTVKDFVAWEGGASAGVPTGWGSTSQPWASSGNTIVRIDYTVDTDTYEDWSYATDNGYPQTQAMGAPDTTPPVPDLSVLPTITGECSVTVTEIPTATDSRVGQVLGTTNDPLTYTEQGTYIITWIYDDGNGNIAYQEQTVIVKDTQPPVPDETNLPDIVGQCSANITTIPTATDNCAGQVQGYTNNPLEYNQQGEYIVTWTYDDGNGNTTTQIQKVIVDDTLPPVISDISASPNILRPPNHKMVQVTVSATVSDNCDSNPTLKIVSITSNEPVNGTGDGDTAPDWEITGDLTVNLRAERSGSGDGRIYTITIQCTDANDNSTTQGVIVTVPHDKKKK